MTNYLDFCPLLSRYNYNLFFLNYSSVSFDICIWLYNHHGNQDIEQFQKCSKFFHTFLYSLPFPNPRPWQPTELFSVLQLCLFQNAYKWNHAVIFVWLLSLSTIHVRFIHIAAGISSLFCYCWVICCCVDLQSFCCCCCYPTEYNLGYL